MRRLMAGILALGLGGCAAASSSLAPSELGITARDAYLEARSTARAWDPGARLRYVEGQDIAGDGVAMPHAGGWRFHYTGPQHATELLVRVAPLESDSEERAPTSPPGFLIGDNALDDAWIDSPAVLGTVLAARADAAGGGTDAVPEQVSLLLVPVRPEQWIVRFPEEGGRWRVNAETGEILEP